MILFILFSEFGIMSVQNLNKIQISLICNYYIMTQVLEAWIMKYDFWETMP